MLVLLVADIKYFWLSNKGPGSKEWVLFEDEPPTKVSEQNCFKCHAYGGACKYGKTPLFVTVGSSRIKAKSKGVDGKVYLTWLQAHMIPACETLMAKRPLVEAQHQWVIQKTTKGSCMQEVWELAFIALRLSSHAMACQNPLS
jgi:hypothetical protein